VIVTLTQRGVSLKIILFKNGQQFFNSSYIKYILRNFSTVLDAAFDTLLSFLPSRHIVMDFQPSYEHHPGMDGRLNFLA